MKQKDQGVAVGANSFSVWSVLAMVVVGGLLFVALLWMVGTGYGMGSDNDGKAHVEGKGLNAGIVPIPRGACRRVNLPCAALQRLRDELLAQPAICAGNQNSAAFE